MREVQNDSENEKSYAHGNPLPKPVRMALEFQKHQHMCNYVSVIELKVRGN
jgi:hypothetical protein